MNMNFNVGGNINKQIVTEEDEVEVVDGDDVEELDVEYTSTTSSSNGNDPKKKLVRMLLLVIGVVAAIIILLLIITSISSGPKTYEEIEEIMTTAAESYFSDHQENLPTKDGATKTVDVSVLVAEGKMKDLSKYTEAGVTCNGTVKVEKSGSTYLYIPELNCGDSYASKEFYEKVRSDNDIVTTGYGLYNKDGNYVFRGEEVNNYVQLDNALWRIVKITSGNNIVLVSSDPIGTSEPWDDRYNQEKGYNTGNNIYGNSRIKESLDELYTTTDESVTKKFLSDNDKAKIVSFNMCTGKRALTETGVEQAVECKEVLRDQKVSLLTAADYMNASTDAGCKSPSSKNCQNYNYLVTGSKWWIATASPSTSYSTYLVNENGNLEEGNASRYAKIRPVVYLNTGVLYKSGSGTSEDPYIVK